jgi:uncharacterized membrane protein YGL010W
MKSLEDQMSFYQAYHHNGVNKLTHFIGVPLIIYAILIPLSWFQFSLAELPLSLGIVVLFFLWIYYVRLNILFALSILLFFVPIQFGVIETIGANEDGGLLISMIAFVLGWIFQLVGHVFEKRRPALVDNLFQVFVAPLFLTAEVFFMLGLKKDVHAEVLKLSERYKA